jgi:hypothetical protein
MSLIRLLLRYRNDDECRGCISDLKIISDLKSFLHTLESRLTCHSFAPDKPHDIITSTSNFSLQRRRLEGKKVKSPQCGQVGSGHINGGPHNAQGPISFWVVLEQNLKQIRSNPGSSPQATQVNDKILGNVPWAQMRGRKRDIHQ